MGELVVANFNSHWGVTRRGSGFDYLSACRDLGAEVLVVEECWRPDGAEGMGAEVARHLGYELHLVELARGVWGRRPRIARRGEPGDGNWGFAVLTRVPVLESERVDLGHLPLDPSPRAALRLVLEAGGSKLEMCATHLSHLSHGSVIQLARLRRVLPDGERAGLLVGDLNMWGPVVCRLLPGWRRAVRGRTWPAHRPHSQIDHILCRGPVEVVASGVLGDRGSDHRPVWARLALP
ncbi:MAG TPA: endonuclease/exonuclease/phosphatase family protein [Acidimicrobiales bacterium]|nr:endonuclease/exonuclease/phosphatase family protein [Acidimicrobiales bacterium]